MKITVDKMKILELLPSLFLAIYYPTENWKLSYQYL
jgi:hypothetical protein